jgi:hypothetical protein
MYENDQEYRAFLRQVIQMDPTRFYETEDIYCDPNDPKVSPETIDEYNYDSTAVAKYLDKVYSDTKDYAEFQQLYKCAAALMFSENPEIGLAVLMSYDYLVFFHNIYCNFMQNTAEWKSDSDEYYIRLINRIETR